MLRCEAQESGQPSECAADERATYDATFAGTTTQQRVRWILRGCSKTSEQRRTCAEETRESVESYSRTLCPTARGKNQNQTGSHRSRTSLSRFAEADGASARHAPRQGSFFLLHACAHNPTGVDPTPEQWKQISKAMLEKGHFAFFDSAYQGFASGDFARDAQSISIFVADGHRVAVSQSYAKNAGLYGQRVGCLSVLCASQVETRAVESQLKGIARPMYSNPPMHGALIVATILGDPALKAQWFQEVKGMADRIILMRTLLRTALEAGGSGSWKHVTDQARTPSACLPSAISFRCAVVANRAAPVRLEFPLAHLFSLLSADWDVHLHRAHARAGGCFLR